MASVLGNLIWSLYRQWQYASKMMLNRRKASKFRDENKSMSKEERKKNENRTVFDGFGMVSLSSSTLAACKILSTIACHRRHNESDEQSGSYTMYSKVLPLEHGTHNVHVNMPYTHIFPSFAQDHMRQHKTRKKNIYVAR